MIEWENLVKCQIVTSVTATCRKHFNSNENTFDSVNGFSIVIAMAVTIFLSLHLWFGNSTIYCERVFGTRSFLLCNLFTLQDDTRSNWKHYTCVCVRLIMRSSNKNIIIRQNRFLLPYREQLQWMSNKSFLNQITRWRDEERERNSMLKKKEWMEFKWNVFIVYSKNSLQIQVCLFHSEKEMGATITKIDSFSYCNYISTHKHTFIIVY